MLTLIFAALLSTVAIPAMAQSGGALDCIIASNDGKKGFRTDEVTACRINTDTGKTDFSFKGTKRTRSYSAKQELTRRHIAAAEYWMNRADSLKFETKRNPAGFDAATFLRQASKATSGFVLVHERKGKRALNVVFITDGVYRSIDFPGTNLKAMPEGLLTTTRW